MRVFFCDHNEIPLPEGHRFPIAKYRLLRERLLSEGLVDRRELCEAAFAPREALERAHSAAYLDAVMNGALDERAQRSIGLPWSPALVRRSLASVGATLGAARAALEDGLAGSLGGGTHHAQREFGEGFCVFNDLAVATLSLLAEGRIERAAVVDVDVHQGDGNAQILGGDERVYLLDLHGEKNFPYRKIAPTHPVPLPDGTDDALYLAKLDAALPSVFAFEPDVVFYLGGVDPLKEDALGRLSLTHAGLRERDRRVLQACRSNEVPVCMVMGGGYAKPIEHTVEAHANTYRAAREVYGQR